MAVQLIFYFFVILDNFKLEKRYVKLKLVLTVPMNLAQLIKLMHKYGLRFELRHPKKN